MRSPFHHTTLSVFRSRLLLNGADGIVLTRTVERAVAAGLFAKRVLAIADSTGVMDAAAVADTYELIRAAIAKLVAGAGGPKALPARLRKRARAYVRDKAAIDWADAAARRAELGALVGMARELLRITADNDDVAEARELLCRIIDQDVEATPDDGGGPAIRRGVAADRVISVVDPEMRHGHKSQRRRIDGYKMQCGGPPRLSRSNLQYGNRRRRAGTVRRDWSSQELEEVLHVHRRSVRFAPPSAHL